MFKDINISKQDDGLDTKPIQSRTALPKSTTVSEALADVGDMDGGDGWGDDTEEWGSLEDTQVCFAVWMKLWRHMLWQKVHSML